MRKIYNKTDNSDFFKTWSSDMAYILGFYTGDGCISKNGNRLFLSFSILEKDIEILEFIRNKINPNRPINRYAKTQKSGYISNFASFKTTNETICRDILNMGFKLNKTYNMVLPNIPNEFKPDYLRGYFDADGCADLNNKRARISCIDNLFLEKIKTETINSGKIVKGKGTYDWEFSNEENINLFKNYIYNGNFCLQRKNIILNSLSFRKKTKIQAFGESKTAGEWSKDKRCNVSESCISKRFEKYKNIISNEEILSLKDRELWNVIPRYIVLSPNKKIYKISNLTSLIKNRPEFKKLLKILSSKRIQTKCGWSIRNIDDKLEEWKEKKDFSLTRNKNPISMSDIEEMWNKSKIENAECLI